MEQAILEAKNKVIGLKQTLRALQQNKVELIYVANDIDQSILRKIRTAGQENNVKVILLRIGKRELGRICRIDVGASVVALVRD